MVKNNNNNNKGCTFTFPVKAALFILSTNISRLNIHGPKKEQIAKRFQLSLKNNSVKVRAFSRDLYAH